MYQNINHTLSGLFRIFDRRCQSKPIFKNTYSNNFTVYKNPNRNNLYFYPVSECYVHSNVECKKLFGQKDSYQSAYSCPLKIIENSKSMSSMMVH